MTHLEAYRDEIDARGEPTDLASAVRAMAPVGWYDCDCGETACVACLCWVALLEVVTERDRARSRLRAIGQELAATPECECGTCVACRIADAVGA